MTNTIHAHRILKAPVSRVYRAFSNPEAKAAWLPPFGFVGHVHSFDFRVGGSYTMSFTNFTTEQRQSWSGTFTVIENNALLVYKDSFDNPHLPGEMTVTVSFKEVSCGTELTIKHEGIPDMIPAEMCYLGWQESLVKLAQLVEPEIAQ